MLGRLTLCASSFLAFVTLASFDRAIARGNQPAPITRSSVKTVVVPSGVDSSGFYRFYRSDEPLPGYETINPGSENIWNTYQGIWWNSYGRHYPAGVFGPEIYAFGAPLSLPLVGNRQVLAGNSRLQQMISRLMDVARIATSREATQNIRMQLNTVEENYKAYNNTLDVPNYFNQARRELNAIEEKLPKPVVSTSENWVQYVTLLLALLGAIFAGGQFYEARRSNRLHIAALAKKALCRSPMKVSVKPS